MSKKILLVIGSLIGTGVSFLLFNSRQLGMCGDSCNPAIDKYQDIFLIFPIVLFFVLVTFWVRDSVFQSWWKFASVTTPVIVAISFLMSLELHHSPGGWFNLDDGIDLLILLALYGFFTLGSIIQIYRGYRAGR